MQKLARGDDAALAATDLSVLKDHDRRHLEVERTSRLRNIVKVQVEEVDHAAVLGGEQGAFRLDAFARSAAGDGEEDQRGFRAVNGLLELVGSVWKVSRENGIMVYDGMYLKTYELITVMDMLVPDGIEGEMFRLE